MIRICNLQSAICNLAATCLIGCADDSARDSATVVRVGSKAFVESTVLAEMLAQLARSAGARAEYTPFGGTQLAFRALVAGEIDVYPEYTGTIGAENLAGPGIRGKAAIREALAARGIRMTRPLGFNNTYVLGMKESRAGELGIRRISDLARRPELEFGFSTEFMNREDGWPSLRARYALPHQKIAGMSHDLAYRAIESGAIDVTDLYSTDAEIAYYGLLPLEDDLGHFPAYHAVLLYRAELGERAPAVVAALERLEGRISETAMIRMNARAKIDRVAATQVAANFLRDELGVTAAATDTAAGGALVEHTLEHLYLVAVSLVAAILVAVPLGIVAAKQPAAGQLILGAAGILQTIPSLALLVFMIPLLGTQAPPAIAALFLYSLLPIVRNTHAGLVGIPPEMRESAEALGLPPAARLWQIELPMASRAILAGIKTSAVINVGTATLGGFIGAGGYGEPIFTGIQLDDLRLILLEGAIPAAVLALAVQGLFELAERVLVPKGLRLSPTR